MISGHDEAELDFEGSTCTEAERWHHGGYREAAVRRSLPLQMAK